MIHTDKTRTIERISMARKLLILWWSRSGSNRRPLECHSSALPTELRPHENDARVKRRKHFCRRLPDIFVISINDLQKSNQQFTTFRIDIIIFFYDLLFALASINSSACCRVRSVILTPPSIRATSKTLCGSERRST